MREVMILNDASDNKSMLFHQWILVRKRHYASVFIDCLYGVCEAQDGTIEQIDYRNIQFKG